MPACQCPWAKKKKKRRKLQCAQSEGKNYLYWGYRWFGQTVFRQNLGLKPSLVYSFVLHQPILKILCLLSHIFFSFHITHWWWGILWQYGQKYIAYNVLADPLSGLQLISLNEASVQIRFVFSAGHFSVDVLDVLLLDNSRFLCHFRSDRKSWAVWNCYRLFPRPMHAVSKFNCFSSSFEAICRLELVWRRSSREVCHGVREAWPPFTTIASCHKWKMFFEGFDYFFPVLQLITP